MSYECATVMHPFKDSVFLWGSLGNGKFIFVDPGVFNDASPRYRWSPWWWLSKLEHDQASLGALVWVEDVNGGVLQREVSFS